MRSIMRAGKPNPMTMRFSNTQPFHIEGCVISDVGMIRLNNEDNYVLDGRINTAPDTIPCTNAEIHARTPQVPWHVAGVFDGIGGGEKGELAAHTAAETFSQAFLEINGPFPKEDVDFLMRQCFLTANNQVVSLKRKYRIYGTTGTVLCTNGVEFKIYHLGDSRAYLFRDGELFQLTKDHTLAQMKLDAGIFDAHGPHSEAAHHILTEYIGRDQTMESIRPVESQWIPFRAGDRVLLCSDGLYDMCDAPQIASILADTPLAKDAAEKLTTAAICNGGADNITCLLIAQTD